MERHQVQALVLGFVPRGAVARDHPLGGFDKQVYSVTVLEAGSLTSRGWQGHVPSEGSKEESFPCLTLASGDGWLFLAFRVLWLRHSSFCLHLT